MAFTTEEQQADAVRVGNAALEAVRTWSGMILPHDASPDEVAAWMVSGLIQCAVMAAGVDPARMPAVFYGIGLGVGGLFGQMSEDQASFLCDELERGNEEGGASISRMSRPMGTA